MKRCALFLTTMLVFFSVGFGGTMESVVGRYRLHEKYDVMTVYLLPNGNYLAGTKDDVGSRSLVSGFGTPIVRR